MSTSCGAPAKTLLTPHQLDARTVAFFLEVPDMYVVLFQALFESYEGVASVRTLGVDPPVVCIMATRDMEPTVHAALDALREEIPWRPTQDSRELFAFS